MSTFGTLNCPRTEGVDSTLAARDPKYGEFTAQCVVISGIEDAMHHSRNWGFLPPDMKESLGMIASKIARILNGDPDYIDSWHDIVGYARLIEKRLEGDKA